MESRPSLDANAKEFHYLDYRDKIQNGDLLVYSSKSFLGRVVRLFTKSDYSHVSICLWLENRLFALEVIPPRIILSPVSTLERLYILPMHISGWNDRHMRTILQPIGMKYSYIDAVLSLFNKTRKVKDHKYPDSWQCAQYVSYFYQQFEIPFGWQETPKDVVAKALSLNGGVKVVLNH